MNDWNLRESSSGFRKARPATELYCRWTVCFADFQTITRSQTLSEPTNITHDIWQTAPKILGNAAPGRPPASTVRLVGMDVSKFDASGHSQGLLFELEEQQKHRQIDSVVDQIKERFGRAVVRRGSGRGRSG